MIELKETFRRRRVGHEKKEAEKEILDLMEEVIAASPYVPTWESLMRGQLPQIGTAGNPLPGKDTLERGCAGNLAELISGDIQMPLPVQLDTELPERFFQLVLINGLGQIALNALPDQGFIVRYQNPIHFHPSFAVRASLIFAPFQFYYIWF